jgi:hypothetical protein
MQGCNFRTYWLGKVPWPLQEAGQLMYKDSVSLSACELYTLHGE